MLMPHQGAGEKLVNDDVNLEIGGSRAYALDCTRLAQGGSIDDELNDAIVSMDSVSGIYEENTMLGPLRIRAVIIRLYIFQ